MSAAVLLLVAGVAIDPAAYGRFADLALSCVHREYPNKIAHVLDSDADVAPPRQLTPVFWGCFDWHSSVHGHWLLARLARLAPDADFVPAARAALDRSLSPEGIAGEVAYFRAPGREGFERPYGLAWLLQLGAELREWEDEDAARWAAALAPLEALAADRLREWLPKLAYPIRGGEHFQTAFAFGLALDWARTTGDTGLEELLVSTSRELYLGDRDCPLAYEPSGHDFLSPCLAEADLVRRILSADDFAGWLASFLPGLGAASGGDWLPVGRVTDRVDGKLAHIDGLNLSRAWMLEGIAAALPPADSRRGSLQAAAAAHAVAGLAGVSDAHYAGSHWLGSFATYLLTGRGLPGGGRALLQGSGVAATGPEPQQSQGN